MVCFHVGYGQWVFDPLRGHAINYPEFYKAAKPRLTIAYCVAACGIVVIAAGLASTYVCGRNGQSSGGPLPLPCSCGLFVGWALFLIAGYIGVTVSESVPYP